MPAQTRPPAVVIVCTRDRPEQLAECLAAVTPTVGPADRAVVVDSASTNPRVRSVAIEAGVEVFRAERPGLSVARNVGVEATTEPIVAFTDDDCRPHPDWLDALSTPFTDPVVGFVTGRVQPDRETRRITVSCVVKTTPETFTGPVDPFACGAGANMAFRRSALAGINGFDELLGAGGRFIAGEDADAFWRLLRSGWTGRYEPTATVDHVQWRSDAAGLRMGWGYGVGAGAMAMKAIRMKDEHGWQLLRSRLGPNGVGTVVRDLRQGYQTGAIGAALTTVGVAAGVMRTARLRVEGGRFAVSA